MDFEGFFLPGKRFSLTPSPRTDSLAAHGRVSRPNGLSDQTEGELFDNRTDVSIAIHRKRPWSVQTEQTRTGRRK